MLPKLEDLVRIVKKRKVFRRNGKSLEVKVIAGLLYFFGLSTRKTSECTVYLKKSATNQFEGITTVCEKFLKNEKETKKANSG